MIRTFIKISCLLLALLLSNELYAAKISKNQAAQKALQQHSGRVLSVKLKGAYYKVKILNKKGQVRTIKIPAKSR